MKGQIAILKSANKRNQAQVYAALIKLMKKQLEKSNPTLKNILKVEHLLASNKEFESKNKLLEKLDVKMNRPVLNVILNYLENSNKILINPDNSITWLYASPKAIESWKKAIKL